MKKVPTAFSGRNNPQRSPEATPPVVASLRPCWMTFLNALQYGKMELNEKPLYHAQPTLSSDAFSMDGMQNAWHELNAKYFQGRLLSIQIVWSRRLTASVGMFVSHMGPRVAGSRKGGERRLIRLSIPLLKGQPQDELIGTLAHEMIHQWQYDILKRRPNHGAEFHRLMAVMNRDGLGITIRHSLDQAVHALTKYTWRCTDCGHDYHRQRNTIRPGRHRCGQCQGALRKLTHEPVKSHSAPRTERMPIPIPHVLTSVMEVATPMLQMRLPFVGS